MNIKTFIDKLKNTPEDIEFSETIGVIEANYTFTPTAFKNGNLYNDVGQNSGSCKLLAFAKLNGFTKGETSACFGKYYFEDVIKDPNGTGHQNIRNFIKTGFDGVVFEGSPLVDK